MIIGLDMAGPNRDFWAVAVRVDNRAIFRSPTFRSRSKHGPRLRIVKRQARKLKFRLPIR